MYSYETEKPTIFTESGQKMFLAIRDHVNLILSGSGAITMGKAIDARTGGDSWSMLACVDRLVELGELREIKQDCCTGQDRIFVKARQ